MSHDPAMKNNQDDTWHGSFKLYVIGFVLSVLLTLAAYFIVVQKVFTGWMLATSIGILGMAQVWVQLILFLHLGDEPKPKWNVIVFSFMVLVVVILVFGSLWIMENLNYNVMPTMPMHHE